MIALLCMNTWSGMGEWSSHISKLCKTTCTLQHSTVQVLVLFVGLYYQYNRLTCCGGQVQLLHHNKECRAIASWIVELLMQWLVVPSGSSETNRVRGVEENRASCRGRGESCTYVKDAAFTRAHIAGPTCFVTTVCTRHACMWQAGTEARQCNQGPTICNKCVSNIQWANVSTPIGCQQKYYRIFTYMYLAKCRHCIEGC